MATQASRIFSRINWGTEEEFLFHPHILGRFVTITCTNISLCKHLLLRRYFIISSYLSPSFLIHHFCKTIVLNCVKLHISDTVVKQSHLVLYFMKILLDTNFFLNTQNHYVPPAIDLCIFVSSFFSCQKPPFISSIFINYASFVVSEA